MPENRDEKPPRWADALLALWVVVVGVVFFGGLFSPTLAALTANLSAFYAIMVLAAALAWALRLLNRQPERKTGREE